MFATAHDVFFAKGGLVNAEGERGGISSHLQQGCSVEGAVGQSLNPKTMAGLQGEIRGEAM